MFIQVKSFLNYFASKMIFINISQNVTIYLFKYFVSHIMLIPRSNTFLYYSTNQVSLGCIILRNASQTTLNKLENKNLNG